MGFVCRSGLTKWFHIITIGLGIVAARLVTGRRRQVIKEGKLLALTLSSWNANSHNIGETERQSDDSWSYLLCLNPLQVLFCTIFYWSCVCNHKTAVVSCHYYDHYHYHQCHYWDILCLSSCRSLILYRVWNSHNFMPNFCIKFKFLFDK